MARQLSLVALLILAVLTGRAASEAAGGGGDVDCTDPANCQNAKCKNDPLVADACDGVDSNGNSKGLQKNMNCCEFCYCDGGSCHNKDPRNQNQQAVVSGWDKIFAQTFDDKPSNQPETDFEVFYGDGDLGVAGQKYYCKCQCLSGEGNPYGPKWGKYLCFDKNTDDPLNPGWQTATYK